MSEIRFRDASLKHPLEIDSEIESHAIHIFSIYEDDVGGEK